MERIARGQRNDGLFDRLDGVGRVALVRPRSPRGADGKSWSPGSARQGGRGRVCASLLEARW